jgi:hypothetical protein
MRKDRITTAYPVTDPQGNVWPCMSLRDYFAGQALAGYSANSDFWKELTHEDTATAAYKAADAMMEARKADE